MMKTVSRYIRDIKGFVQDDVDTIIETLMEFKELYCRIWNSDLPKGEKILCYLILIVDSLFISVVTSVCISLVILIKVVMALVLVLGMVPFYILMRLLSKINTQ